MVDGTSTLGQGAQDSISRINKTLLIEEEIMPCYSPLMHKDEFGNWKDGEIPQEHFDKLVRLLCEANRVMDDYGTGVVQSRRSKESLEWWKAHKFWDGYRI